jgi:hypothetical protein
MTESAYLISEGITMRIFKNIAKWIDHELGIDKIYGINLELEASDFI